MNAPEVLEAVQNAGGVPHTERRANSVRPARFCGLAGPRTQTEPGAAGRIVERRRDSSTDATWRSAAEMGTEDPSSCDRPHGDR